MALYAQAISQLYMHKVRQLNGTNKNALDLGPLHIKVKAHCNRIADNPDLLLAPDVSHTNGALDGEMWHHSHIVYAAHKLILTHPHLKGTLSAFFCGAAATWEWFSLEFDPHSAIAPLSPVEHHQACMNATNDHNEGALGAYQVGARRAPKMTLTQWNAHAIYKHNGTWCFIKSLTHRDWKYIKQVARAIDAGKVEQEWCQAQAEADVVAVVERCTVDAAKQKKHE